MDFNNLFVWYQQKIGTYDKQRWETKIEQREQRIYGLNHIQTRRTKPNTDLIDLDLVRGSSFTKAKPQFGFIKVARLATLRCIFYPIYGKWWIKQTSHYVFGICILLYILLVFNVFLYFVYLFEDETAEQVSCMEILIPVIMMWVLSLIHSQIVSTSPAPDLKPVPVSHRHFRRKRNSSKKGRHLGKHGNGLEVDAIEKIKRNPFIPTQNEKKISKSNCELTIDALNKCDEKIVKKNYSSQDNPIKAVADGCDMNNLNSIGDCPENSRINTLNIKSCGSDSESEKDTCKPTRKASLIERRHVRIPTIIKSCLVDSTCDSEDEIHSSPDVLPSPLSGDLTSSATEWMGVTTNSEDCSYSSDIDNISDSHINGDTDYLVYDNDLAPTDILNPPALRVSCVIWERNETKKADLSMLDISSVIIGKVDEMPESMDYFFVGIAISTVVGFLPFLCRFSNSNSEFTLTDAHQFIGDLYKNITSSLVAHNQSIFELYLYIVREIPMNVLVESLRISSCDFWILAISSFQRWVLACMIFFLLCVAERTFKQRLLYAKLFSHLTSSRRARKSELPHFRLNKVRNIKTWLSVRSYLKKRGPQRSVDVIVSTAFIVNLLLLTFLCVELLKDSVSFSQYYLESLTWCLGLGIVLLRFMTLGTKINKKFRNLSVLITEQINLHLQIEQKPHKKEEYTVANNVLKLAIDLLKELENPFKISGLSANPILYNVTKLVILSALSGVLSEMLGFKLKLHKIKLK